MCIRDRRYIARDLGPSGIRVNAISAGPMRTLALAGIKGGRDLVGTGREWSLMKEDTSMEGIAGCALWLLSDIGASTTAEVIHVDAGFHVVGAVSYTHLDVYKRQVHVRWGHL